MVGITRWMGEDPLDLRYDIQNSDSTEVRLRRGVVAVSLVGIAAMAFTTMLQTGIVKRLPDPPIGNFDTKKVNSSEEAYSYGGPDSPITIAAHSVNMILASMGGPDRAERHPWLPLLAATAAGAQAVVAAKYLFYQMPKVDRAWCPYCIVDALTHFATLALALPEAGSAATSLLQRSMGTDTAAARQR